MDFVGNNGFATNNNMGFGVPQGTGYQFNGMQPQQVPQIQNFLSTEEINRLLQKENQFSLALTEVEKLRATCNHRFNGNGQDAIVTGNDGICRCQICGYEFAPIDEGTTPDTLNEVVRNMLDVLQTIKLFYLDMPAEVAREYFAIIPLIEKVPKLFDMAVKSYSKYESYNPYGYNNKNMNTMQMYSMLAGILGGQQPYQQPNMGYGYQAQPQMNPGMGMAYQQPMMGQPMGMGMTGSNGFVMQPGMNPGGYQPTTQNVSYVPNAGQPVATPTAAPVATPAADIKTDGTVEATQSFTV